MGGEREGKGRENGREEKREGESYAYLNAESLTLSSVLRESHLSLRLANVDRLVSISTFMIFIWGRGRVTSRINEHF